MSIINLNCCPVQTQKPLSSMTPSPTSSVVSTVTPTITLTRTNTATPTITSSITATPTITRTITPTPDPSSTPTITPTPTITITPSITSTNTPTPSITPTLTITPSITPSSSTQNPVVCNSISWADTFGYINSANTTVSPGDYIYNPMCYNNLTCSSKPPNNNMYAYINILLANISAGTTVFSFSNPITNPILALFSLGDSVYTTTTGVCSVTPVLYCGDVTGNGCEGSGSSSSIIISGNSIIGNEGYGIVVFPGTHSTISITWSNVDSCAFRWGACL